MNNDDMKEYVRDSLQEYIGLASAGQALSLPALSDSINDCLDHFNKLGVTVYSDVGDIPITSVEVVPNQNGAGVRVKFNGSKI